MQAIKPVIGMGLTVKLYTDRITFTIVSVSPSGKSFKAIQDQAIRIDSNGMSDVQEYRYEAGQGEPVSFRLGTKTGRYKCRMGYAVVGVRNAYHDYSF